MPLWKQAAALLLPLFVCSVASAADAHTHVHAASDAAPSPLKYDQALLQKLRIAAASTPGALPLEVRYIKFAESPRTFAATVEGGENAPYIQARTAYQLAYPDSRWIMVDAGMDAEVHEFFGRGKAEPYDALANAQIQQALLGASKILITHEHGDHVAGVLRTQHYAELAPKTLLTVRQMKTLLEQPQMPQLQMRLAQRDDFTVVDFHDVLPVAPGVALVQAPGHTPGEVMVYAKLQNGREYMIVGDVSWSYRGIDEKKQKPKAQIERIGEDAVTIQFQLDWLNQLQAQGVQLIVNHDDIVQPRLVRQGVLVEGLLTR